MFRDLNGLVLKRLMSSKCIVIGALEDRLVVPFCSVKASEDSAIVDNRARSLFIILYCIDDSFE